MPVTGVSVSLVGDERSRWRLGRGETRVTPLEPGSVFVFAGDGFAWARNDRPYAGLSLRFDLDLLRRAAERAGFDAAGVDLRPARFARDETLLGIAGLMAAELRAGGIGGRLYEDSLGTLALVHLLRHHAGLERLGRERPFGLTGAKLRRVTALMGDRLAEPLALADLAAAASMSAYHFARAFKRTTGRPPHAHLTALRMDRVRKIRA